MSRTAAIILVLSLAWSGCSTDPHGNITPARPFVLIAYMAADNSLSGEALQKLEALRQGYDTRSGAEVFVYIDSGEDVARLLKMRSRAEETHADIVAEYPESNSASAGVFAGIIEQVRKFTPDASGYGLIIFSHASGWLTAGALHDPRSVGNNLFDGFDNFDHQAGDYPFDGTRSILQDKEDEMELADLAAAIPDGLFDYIVFETCFMAGIESLYVLRAKTPYIMASAAEIVSPGFTSIYPDALRFLMKGSDGLVTFAQDAFDHYDNQTGWLRSATFSVIRTAGLEPLMQFIRENIDPSKEMDLKAVQSFDRYGNHLFFDLSDCYSKALGSNSSAIAELQELIAGCVMFEASTPWFLQGYAGFPVTTHSGLTTYWPQEQFPGLNALWIERMGFAAQHE